MRRQHPKRSFASNRPTPDLGCAWRLAQCVARIGVLMGRLRSSSARERDTTPNAARGCPQRPSRGAPNLYSTRQMQNTRKTLPKIARNRSKLCARDKQALHWTNGFHRRRAGRSPAARRACGQSGNFRKQCHNAKHSLWPASHGETLECNFCSMAACPCARVARYAHRRAGTLTAWKPANLSKTCGVRPAEPERSESRASVFSPAPAGSG